LSLQTLFGGRQLSFLGLGFVAFSILLEMGSWSQGL